jgi:G:T-mismatch repair DNA endonuclease (very short patch repair protein)
MLQEIRKKLVSDIWEHDRKKILDLKENGYDVLIIWENDYYTNPEHTINLCINFVYEN